MGQRTRHFIALSKKNWIVWKRTLGSSLCELFCPVALMAIITIARALIDSNIISPQSNMQSSILMAPMVNVSNIMGSQSNQSSVLGGFSNIQAVFQEYQSLYGGFANLTKTNLTTNNPLIQFVPTHCSQQDQGLTPATPIIAVAGPPQYLGPLINDLNALIQLQQESSNIGQLIAETNPKLYAQLQAAGIPLNLQVNLTIQIFPSGQAIMDYLTSTLYMQDQDHLGLCFGFSINETVQDDIDVKLYFSGEVQDPNTQSIPYQLNPVWSEFIGSADFTSYYMYTQQGYSLLHNWIANSVLRVKSGNQNASIAFTYVPFKTDQYVSDQFSLILSGMLPFFMLLMYILPMYRLISNIVSEKESRARESMKMMGLNDVSYWLSWLFYYTIIVTLISVLCLIVLAPTVFVYSSKGLIFLFFWIYGMSLFGLAVFLQSFFSRARVAAISGTLVYFGTSFVNAAVADPNVAQGSKNGATLLTTVAVSLASNNIAQFESSGIGVTNDNFKTVYQNYTLSACIIIMVISMFLFFFAGIYLDNVLPSTYGVRKPFWFCLSPRFWLGHKRQQRRAKSPSQADNEGQDDAAFFEAKHMKKENFEPVAKELLKQETEQKILKISELHKTFENGFQAVKGVNLKMYNGQIFALLGHNGAGKTTTISMLTGLIESTSGNAEVLGYDIFNEMNDVRQFMGVCPQHDILFEMLTPEEHLDIFCEFKGVDRKIKDQEIKKMLIDVDVYNFKDTLAGNLSGGSKRKLSVAIALIGGSKLVLLDEPSSGLDLSARRKLWNMLKNYKQNRIIILTTHYMDEADILGDRIGIMTGGQVICLGSSLFLKNRFGVGYNLTMVKMTKEPNTAIGPYLQKSIGPEVKMLSEVSSEITYQIPNALSYKFKEFFETFDNQLEGLGIRSYGISVTTLEEVFLKVGHGDDTNDSHQLKKSLLEQNQTQGNNFLSIKQQQEDDFSISDPQYHPTAVNGFVQHLTALFLKRFYIYRRNRKGLVIEVLIPVLLVLIGFGFSQVQFFLNEPVSLLQPGVFPLKQRILSNQYLIQSASDPSKNINPSTLLQSLPMVSSDFDITYDDYSSLYQGPANTSQVGTKFDNDVFQNRYNGSLEPTRFGSYFIYQADNSTKQFKASVFMNLTSQDVAAYYPQFLYEAILQQALGKPKLNFNVSTAPYPVTYRLKQRAATANGIFIAFVVSIGFALIPAMVVSFILNEREKNLKHMQLISGMSLPAYWISNLIFDIIKALFPSAIVIGLSYAFNLNYNYSWILFLLFPVGVVPFTYVTSFLFTSENVAQTITIFLHFVFAGIGAIVVFILRFIPSTQKIGDALSWAFKVIPTYCLTETIMFDSSSARLFQVRPELKKDSNYDITLVGGDILVICLHFIVWMLVLVLIELGFFNWTGRLASALGKNKIQPKDDRTLDLDDDVIEEERRVQASADMKVRVHRFRKIYPSLFSKPVLAVEKSSFGLDYGECFALLGINGAGKSTTFKALTNDIEPSSGDIKIQGFDIQRDFSQARKLIGYCPQDNAIFDLVTVEEHLEYYARLKGIPDDLRPRLIERQIEDMNLSEHRTKPAGTLSGGNKRKLSVAMAIIGNPPIILLDEPSAGMDPEARRFMWSVVAKISQQRKKSAVILTTHSMEEAEALSTKMGIMVKGGVFRCFGSSQHIKNKFGTGYEIEVKVRKLPIQDLNTRAASYGINTLTGEELVPLKTLIQLMKDKGVEQFLIDEVKTGGLGGDLVKEAIENGNGMVNPENFLHWLYVEEAGMQIINGICKQFASVEILEHYSDYFKMRVPRGDKTIGFLFGLIESNKDNFNISEYSVSQTTLEQIFQAFANIKIDDDSQRKLQFKQPNSSSRAELYSEKADVNTDDNKVFTKNQTVPTLPLKGQMI